jgi:protein involved in polysaccharide export with SLBB domain
MRYKVGDKVKVKIAEFKEAYGENNVWVIDSIKTQAKGYPSLYLCYNENDKHKMLFNFTEEDVEGI